MTPLTKGRPQLATVRERHHALLDEDGNPFALDVHDDLYRPGEDGNPSTRPSQCRGPNGRMCGRVNFCTWCHERRTHANAVKVAMIHIGQPNIHRIRIPLGQGRTHPKHARDCLRRVSGVLRRHNFTRQTLWLHAFDENPFHGPRAHIEGIVSGNDADPDILDPTRPGGLGLILKRFQAGGVDSGQPIEVHVERLHPHSRKHVDELVRHGLECGRPSWPTRRIHAGLYLDKKGRTRCRLTDVHDKSRPTHIKDIPCESPDHIPDATGDDLLTMAIVAEHWREAVSKPVMTRNVRVEPVFADLVVRATLWRDHYVLPSDSALETRWCMLESPPDHPARGCRQSTAASAVRASV